MSFLLVLLTAAAPAPLRPLDDASPVSWIQPRPEEESERALARVLADLPREAGAGGRLGAFTQVAEAYSGTTGSGLARLGSGFVLLELQRFDEAAAVFEHPDVARTALRDHALFALGRAHEGRKDLDAAAEAYARLLSEFPHGSLQCSALLRRADALAGTGRSSDALAALRQTLAECSGRAPLILLRLGFLHEQRGERVQAAHAFDAIVAGHPGAYEAREAEKRLAPLRKHLPAPTTTERRRRDLDRAQALMDAGRVSAALPILKSLHGADLPAEQAETVRVRLARALVVLGRDREAEALLRTVPATSPFAAEAAYHRARIAFGRSRDPRAYDAVVASFPSTAWAEEALYTMAFHHDRQLDEDAALPHYRRLLEMFPAGQHVDRAAWAVAWWKFRHGRVAEAAAELEGAARERPRGAYTARFLYWAGRARAALGEESRARALYEETVQRFKHVYHGLRAAEALGLVRGGGSSTHPATFLSAPERPDVPEPQLTRIRQLLLIHRLDEAGYELERVQPSSQVHATLAWIQWRAGQLRPAIRSMKRAFPDWLSHEGDSLPTVVWQILYPMRYQDELVAAARAQGLDPALVAGLIWQESTFEATATSPVGARGLMQVMPRTGRELARRLGLKYTLKGLHDPDVALRMGTLYLRQRIDAYGGGVERALAAYNAGPGRVRAWTSARPGMSAEEFVESIPFTETRNYVMGILAHQEHYRRLYGLPPVARRSAMAAALP